jgi:hypothetical protein
MCLGAEEPHAPLRTVQLMNLRDFLEERERELTDELAERKRKQMPFEAELAEIRHAKEALSRTSSALGMDLGIDLNIDIPGSPPSQMNKLRAYLESREHELKAAVEELGAGLEELVNELAEIEKVKTTIGTSDSPEAVGVLYQSLSIGELVIKALKNHFQNGATIGELVAFFREKWGRDVDRPSLSPQLSRLYKRDVLGRIPSLPGWFLIPDEAGRDGRRPYRHRGNGKIYLKRPSQVDEQDERLLTNSTDPRGGAEPHDTIPLAAPRALID